jgi:hypothetical protein
MNLGKRNKKMNDKTDHSKHTMISNSSDIVTLNYSMLNFQRLPRFQRRPVRELHFELTGKHRYV